MKICSISLIMICNEYQGNTLQNQMSYSHLFQWLSLKIQEISVGEGVEKKDSLYTVGGNVNWYSYNRKHKNRVPWTARRSNLSILKEINPEYSLEGLMLNCQYSGHLMRRTKSLEKTLMLGKIEGSRRRSSDRG